MGEHSQLLTSVGLLFTMGWLGDPSVVEAHSLVMGFQDALLVATALALVSAVLVAGPRLRRL